MKELRERARGNPYEQARNWLAARGVERTARAMVGALEEVEYRTAILTFLGGLKEE